MEEDLAVLKMTLTNFSARYVIDKSAVATLMHKSNAKSMKSTEYQLLQDAGRLGQGYS